MGKTKIAWTESVWNPVTGCTKVAAGCQNCYAESFARRKMGMWKERDFCDVQVHPERLNIPLKVKKPAVWFVDSMGDLFHEKVPFEFIESVYAHMHLASGKNYDRHKFILLTKRVERMKEFYDKACYNPVSNEPLKNLFVGASISTRDDADRMIPILLQVPGKKVLSLEPLVGQTWLKQIEIDKIDILNCLTGEIYDQDADRIDEENKMDKIDWVIVGAESGPKMRYCNLGWILQIARDCKEAKVPLFIKQIHKFDKNAKLKLYKDIKEFPKDLQVREWPEELKII